MPRFMALLLVLGAASVAEAQTASVNASTFSPAAGRYRVFSVEQAAVGPSWAPYAHVLFHGERESLAVRVGSREEVLVDQHWFADLNIGIGLFGYLQLDVSLPVALAMSAGDDVRALTVVEGPGLGDVAIRLRGVPLSSLGGGFGVGLSAVVTVPTGDGDQFRGDPSGSFHGSVILEYRFPVVALTLNVGARVRFEETTVVGLEFGNELTYGLGLDVQVWDTVEIGLEFYGRTPLDDPFGGDDRSGLEGMLGPRWFMWNGLALELGVGAGLVRGVGTPDFRFLTGLSWAPSSDDVKAL